MQKRLTVLLQPFVEQSDSKLSTEFGLFNGTFSFR